MSTYSTVDTILTPSLIDISPITYPGINRGILQSMGSETQLNISAVPISNNNQAIIMSDSYNIQGNFPQEATGQGVPVINVISDSGPAGSISISQDNMVTNIPSNKAMIESPSLTLLSSEQSDISNDGVSVINNDGQAPPSSPIDSLLSARRTCLAASTQEVIGCLRKTRKGKPLGDFPLKDLPSIPAFAPPKNISIDVATSSTLKEQLRDTDLSVRQKALTLLEKRIVMMQGKCPDSIVENLRIRVFQLDPAIMSDYLNSYGKYDHDYQDGMGCLIDALISNEDIVPDIRLRRWITDINRIGGDSAEGMAFKLSSNPTKLDGTNSLVPNSSPYPLYVIKVAADPSEDSLPHEALVGMGAVNKVRDRIPNFMHTYGAFMCAPPVLDSNGSVVSWCPSKTDGITYLVLENIQDAVSLKSLARDLNDSEFLQIYLQVLNALNVAYKEFDFTHYDLHDGNVLIQILPYDVSVPFYTQDGGVYYIRTRHLARIIDYGMSHIYLQGQHFGKYYIEHAGVDPESSFPMHDAYKILLFTYTSSLQISNNDRRNETRYSSGIANIASGIYEFFNERTTINARVAARSADPWRDYYQPSTSYKNLTFDDLISFIISKYRIDFITSEQPSDAIATICKDVCVGWNEFTQHVFNKSKLPVTLEDYCQAEIAIDKLSNNQTRTDLQKWIRQFNVEHAYEQEKNSIVYKLNTSVQGLNSISLLTLDDPSFNHEIYKRHLKTLVRIQYQLLNVNLWLQAVACAFNRNSNISYITDDLTQLVKGSNDAYQRLNDYQTIIQYNISNDITSSFNGETSLLHNIILTPLN